MGRFRFIFALILIVSSLFLASGTYTYYPGHENWDSEQPGIITGFIHGVIAPIMVFGSIITDYRIYEPNNIGWFYDFFFVLGFLIAWGGTTTGGTKIINKYYNKQQKESSALSSIEKKLDEKISVIKEKSKGNKQEKQKEKK
jgi:hypothetical protein